MSAVVGGGELLDLDEEVNFGDCVDNCRVFVR